MRLFDFARPIPLLLASALSGFWGCDGTSTETENTLGLVPGRALRAEGAPASGARIILRSREIIAEGMALSWRVLDSATADGQGRFEMKLPEGREIFLEIKEADPAGPHPLVHFTRYDSAGIRPRRFGDLLLAPSGSLEGRLAPRQGAPTENLWVGVAGTSALIRLAGSADTIGLPFRLDGLPAGEHVLTVATVGGGVSGPKPPEPPLPVAVASDTITDAGRVFFEDAVRIYIPRPP